MENLKNLKKQELIDRCKQKGLNTYGTKIELINRLLSKKSDNIISTIKHSIPPIIIKKYGNEYIHDETGLIFDIDEKIVIGKKGSEKLSIADIELCKKYKFRYKLPDNLLETQKITPGVDDLLYQRLLQIGSGEGNDDDASENDEDDP